MLAAVHGQPLNASQLGAALAAADKVAARKEMTQTLRQLGHKTLALEASATRNGAVETPAEGQIYANFLRAHRAQVGRVPGIEHHPQALQRVVPADPGPWPDRHQ